MSALEFVSSTGQEVEIVRLIGEVLGLLTALWLGLRVVIAKIQNVLTATERLGAAQAVVVKRLDSLCEGTKKASAERQQLRDSIQQIREHQAAIEAKLGMRDL